MSIEYSDRYREEMDKKYNQWSKEEIEISIIRDDIERIIGFGEAMRIKLQEEVAGRILVTIDTERLSQKQIDKEIMRGLEDYRNL